MIANKMKNNKFTHYTTAGESWKMIWIQAVPLGLAFRSRVSNPVWRENRSSILLCDYCFLLVSQVALKNLECQLKAIKCMAGSETCMIGAHLLGKWIADTHTSRTPPHTNTHTTHTCNPNLCSNPVGALEKLLYCSPFPWESMTPALSQVNNN